MASGKNRLGKDRFSAAVHSRPDGLIQHFSAGDLTFIEWLRNFQRLVETGARFLFVPLHHQTFANDRIQHDRRMWREVRFEIVEPVADELQVADRIAGPDHFSRLRRKIERSEPHHNTDSQIIGRALERRLQFFSTAHEHGHILAPTHDRQKRTVKCHGVGPAGISSNILANTFSALTIDSALLKVAASKKYARARLYKFGTYFSSRPRASSM